MLILHIAKTELGLSSASYTYNTFLFFLVYICLYLSIPNKKVEHLEEVSNPLPRASRSRALPLLCPVWKLLEAKVHFSLSWKLINKF